MTNWLPDLSKGTGPLYLRLADQIETDIGGGALPPGEKLPPQRNLAFDIGVTIGTVTRAYAVARERGLVSGEVGRGTYVLDRNVEEPPARSAAQPLPERLTIIPEATPAQIKLRMDTTSAPDVGQAAIIHDLLGQITLKHADKIGDYTRAWPQEWREAGRKWLASGDWAPDPQSIVPTTGVHAAIMAVIAAVTAPGDKIAFEQLTYASISRSANLIGRRSVVFANDGNGADADDFERLCAQQHPKLVFLMPAVQNPTLSVVPIERLNAIVEVARKYNVWLIEDAIFATLLENRYTPLAALAPERTFHVGGLSKAVAAGVRGGFAACPAHMAPRVQTAHKMVTGGLPFILAELTAQLVNSGQAEAIREKVRREIAEREALARRIFDGIEFSSHRNIPYLWMKLPEPWLSGTFKQVAANEGVLIDDEDEYKPARAEKVFHRIRIGFSMPSKREQVVGGFNTLRRLLDHGSAGYDSYG
ncbi:PLP-dependent aminotransferase family protein [Mesorhizobium sp. LHD-90]|uniref:aminotransferase-like domain-containing protein n=1 Tax=Mesorhizobium sp. LHD-90 TaxID=3071414 RepID=UPI0027E040ED|nr:PLP-dependent aminotransferase family protein [Mesorhizobium sp. LHD-90]MDQ6433111.1 PLP-dependent aminotransferase family protein [Mesorhizobium sp. LHD-90]